MSKGLKLTALAILLLGCSSVAVSPYFIPISANESLLVEMFNKTIATMLENEYDSFVKDLEYIRDIHSEQMIKTYQSIPEFDWQPLVDRGVRIPTADNGVIEIFFESDSGIIIHDPALLLKILTGTKFNEAIASDRSSFSEQSAVRYCNFGNLGKFHANEIKWNESKTKKIITLKDGLISLCFVLSDLHMVDRRTYLYSIILESGVFCFDTDHQIQYAIPWQRFEYYVVFTANDCNNSMQYFLIGDNGAVIRHKIIEGL